MRLGINHYAAMQFISCSALFSVSHFSASTLKGYEQGLGMRISHSVFKSQSYYIIMHSRSGSLDSGNTVIHNAWASKF